MPKKLRVAACPSVLTYGHVNGSIRFIFMEVLSAVTVESTYRSRSIWNKLKFSPSLVTEPPGLAKPAKLGAATKSSEPTPSSDGTQYGRQVISSMTYSRRAETSLLARSDYDIVMHWSDSTIETIMLLCKAQIQLKVMNMALPRWLQLLVGGKVSSSRNHSSGEKRIILSMCIILFWTQGQPSLRTEHPIPECSLNKSWHNFKKNSRAKVNIDWWNSHGRPWKKNIYVKIK